MIRIRKAERGDLAFIAALERETFSLPQSEAAFTEMLGKADHLLLLAERDDAPIGYICAYTVCRESDILTVAVTPTARRSGAGRALIKALLDALAGSSDAIFLEVRQSNAPARALYTAMGFCEVGIRRGYYRQPREDAVLYTKELHR